jgi:hypothetical protein
MSGYINTISSLVASHTTQTNTISSSLGTYALKSSIIDYQPQITSLSGQINTLSSNVYNSSTTSLSGVVTSLPSLVNSLALDTTNVGDLNVGDFNMATYDTTQGSVAPNYPNYFPIPFPSNYFSCSSGLQSVGIYKTATSPNSTLPAYQAYKFERTGPYGLYRYFRYQSPRASPGARNCFLRPSAPCLTDNLKFQKKSKVMGNFLRDVSF